MSSKKRKGFTLVEVVVAFALFAIGIVASVLAITGAAAKETGALKTERAASLAQQKLDEIIGLGDISNANGSGDFSHSGEANYNWSVETGESGVTNLSTITVTVNYEGSGETGTAHGLFYTPPEATTAPAGVSR